ncbi:hypothetical protein VNO78_33352 [Psophocarpus tetragonolobus]|uniref:Uncharacterized protein n=1 Tax=Psophocarpus tetragonolobus TaxID=3891 RepID=A0AAN9P207_PSOTE
MSGVVRAALRSKCTTSVCALVQRSHGLSVRCFSTETEQPPMNSSPAPPFFGIDNSGVTYGRMFGIRKHVLKTDIVNYLEGCNLTLDDVKMDYNRNFFPISTLLQFPTRDSYDNAVRLIVRKGRIYKLERADRYQWDQVKPYDGKTILIEGLPRTAIFEDVARILADYGYDASSMIMSLRPAEAGGGADSTKSAVMRLHSRTQAMNACIQKNGTFCQNNRIWMHVIQ